jgi:hypothetical protein
VAVVLQDLKERLSGAPSDVELNDLLAAAIELAERVVGPLVPTPATEIVTSGYLSRTPVLSITSATYGGLATTATLLDPLTGAVAVVAGSVVAYTYGFNGPTPLQREIILEVTRRAVRGTQQGYRPGYGDSPETTEGMPPGIFLTGGERATLLSTLSSGGSSLGGFA